MIRECPECKCEILYKKKRSYEAAKMKESLCRKCNFAKIAKDPERNRKLSERRKKWWEEKRKNEEEYAELCEKLGKNNAGVFSDESRKNSWLSSRWSEEKRAEWSKKMKQKWETLTEEDLTKRKRRMVSARVENETIGRNNKRKCGSFEGVEYESSTEERFLKSHLRNLGLKRAAALVSEDCTYKPDFWSDTLQCYVEVKSTWTFNVMRGLRRYNSRSQQQHTQLEKIVSLCSKSAIKICVEIGRNFYVLDPVKVTELTNVVEDGELLRFGFDDNIEI